MELYATGFNAWNQLCFDAPDATPEAEPDDLDRFTCVLRDDSLTGLRPCFSYTLVHTAAGLRSAGLIPKEDAALHAGNDSVYMKMATASNGTVIVSDGSGNIHQYASVSDILSGQKQAIYSGFPRIAQLVAYDAGFAILSSTGQVWTWGDERYAACLGRDATEQNPASRPRQVAALQDLPTGPIVKLAAGGYIVAALTSGNDLYAWGGHPGRPAILHGIGGEPSPVLVEEYDIVDVGVGDSHLIALTAEGHVFAIGDNKSGQLGLDTESATSWTRVDLGLDGERHKVTGVAAGPRNSFVVVANQD